MRSSLVRAFPALVVTLALVANTAATNYSRTNTPDVQNQENKPLSLPWTKEAVAKLETELVAKYGEGQRSRLQRGLTQITGFWRAEDGDRKVFEQFVRTEFAGDQPTLDAMFGRFQHNLEQLDGHMQEIGREFRQQADLDAGPILPFDELFAGYDASAHTTDDFFKNKLAFVVLLNFPLSTLEQRLTDGEKWSRRQWAETRLAQRFSKRIPAEVNLAIAQAAAEADRYIAEYNIWMHHLVNERGDRLFPAKLRLLSHWNLRDEIKANYTEGEKGLAKQRMIQQVMERIVSQTIPEVVVNNPNVDWNPVTNEVKPAAVKDTDDSSKSTAPPTNAPEPNTRYAKLLLTFQASRKADPYSPTAPTLIARRFDENREIPEQRVRQMFEQVLSSPLRVEVAKLIESRLGRPLEPFDIWYNGFRPRGTYTESQLDQIVSKRYPTADTYKQDIPNLLTQLGFSKERAGYLAENIVVDPARGSGHAMGASMRSAKAHLRTRVGKTGMDYKGFNIAVHEMGHNVEQTFSLNNIDYYTLQGVPNTAFTEALAFVFQARDLELLGLAKPDEKSRALKTLDDFWGTAEIAGVALVDMGVWHWMYEHPDAIPAQLKDATLQISKDVWNKYYAPIFKTRDVVILGVYSHMIDSFLYLPDYPIGHMIAFQIEEQMEKSGNIGSEFERMATAGSIVPDLWMKKATGAPVGPEALLTETEKALKAIRESRAASEVTNKGENRFMNCPVCISVKLALVELESNLSSLWCPQCGGNWIRGATYWRWLEEHGPNLPEVDNEGEVLPIAESDRYLDCPECRFRMIKCLVGRGLDFSVDHCQGCKGIWLDRNEWEALKRRNLHDDLNSMLTAFWQTQAKKEARRKSMEQIYISRFGADDYAEIKRVRIWLDANRNKQHLLAYLTDVDPFDV